MAAEEEHNKYSDCCIYKITVGDEFYIGSTNNFTRRRQRHKDCIKNTEMTSKIYNAIRAEGKWTMERLYNINVSSKREQLEEERKASDELKPTLNEYRALITHEELLQHCKEKQRI